MKHKKWVGLGLLLVIILVAILYQTFLSGQPQKVRLKGLLGGEKIGLFESDAFTRKMRSYALQMDYRKAGSFAMAEETARSHNQEGYDYLFPASQLASQYYKKLGGTLRQEEIVFNSPLVLYTRKPVAEALRKRGIVREQGGVSYLAMKPLAELIGRGTSWKELGLTDLYGNIFVDTTDPNASNSGNTFLGLLANALNNNRVVHKADVPALLPKIKAIYQQIGNMQTSSADMFSQFLRLGMGSFPIIAGYENQLLELSKQEAEVYQQVQDELVLLYPQPTTWASHVYLALTDQGKRGIEALKSPNIQRMAWKNHGFRTIVSGTADPREFSVKGVPETINQVMPMPDIDVMLQLMEALKN